MEHNSLWKRLASYRGGTEHHDVELERIGDYAEGIAKIVIMIGDEPPLKPLIDIPRMSESPSK